MRPSPLPRDAASAKGGIRETGSVEAARESRSRPCRRRTKRQSLDRVAEEFAISQCRGRHYVEGCRNSRRSRHARSRDDDLRTSRQCHRGWEIQGSTGLLYRDQPHAHLLRPPALSWYLVRDMGFINKMYRGLAKPDVSPGEVDGETNEKPWIAAVEKFAIGGGCQYLLATDYNIAAKDAYMTLPARKEGIIPGAANMRMPRFVGDRITRQAIMSELRIECDSPTGRMICDRIVEPEQMDQAIDEAVELLTNSGAVNASSNRKAIRVVQEPLDVFRTYMAVYAREQAYCHFSPALVSNLERFWNAQQRKL